MAEEQADAGIDSEELVTEKETVDISPAKYPRGRALSKLRREPTEEELTASGTSKLLIDRIESLEAELDELKPIREQFHHADKIATTFRERLSKKPLHQLLEGVSLTVGGALFGLAQGASEQKWYLLAVAIVLIILPVVIALREYRE